MRLNRALDLFDLKLAEEGRTPATRKKYVYDVLGPFAKPFGADALVADPTRDDCRLFLGQWRGTNPKTGKPYSPSTAALHTSILNVFFEYAVEEEWRDDNPMARVARPHLKHPDDLDVVTVGADDVALLFAACEALDEEIALNLLVYTGGRRTAAANLRWRDVDFRRGTARFVEKGQKVNVQPLADELHDFLYAVALSGEVPNAPDDYVIPNRASGRAPGSRPTFRSMAGRDRSPKVVYKLIKGLGERAGVDVHPHALRAAFAVAYLEARDANGAPLGDVLAAKDLLNHSRVETTLVYLRRRRKMVAKETVRGLSWAAQLQPRSVVPPAGFEPALGAKPLADPSPSNFEKLRAASAELRQGRPRAVAR